MAVAAVTRAVAGRCGENAADKGADSGWMRLDEDCGGRGRALLALRGTAMRSKRFDSAPSTRSVQGGRIESRWRTTSYSSSFRPAFTRWFRIFLICTGFWITADHGIACGNPLTELRSGGKQVGRLRRPERAGGPTHGDVHARLERRSPLEAPLGSSPCWMRWRRSRQLGSSNLMAPACRT